MAEVEFCSVWVHLASDLSDCVELGLRAWSSPKSAQVDVRRRANGRTVAVTRPGVTRTASIEVLIEDRNDLEWLEAKLGRLVLIRSPRGQRVWGVFGRVDYSEPIDREIEFPASLTIGEVTVSEAV